MSLTATATATSALPRVHAHARSQSQSSSSFAPKAATTRVPDTPLASATKDQAAATTTAISSGQPPTGKKKDRPCDACRRRKSRCVMHEGEKSCVLCQFHSQDCTFVQSPQPRTKRRLPTSDGAGTEEQNASKKRTRDSNSPASKDSNKSEPAKAQPVTVESYAQLKEPTLLRKTLGLEIGRHSRYVGPTSEYEECLIDLCPLDSENEYGLAHGGHFRRCGNGVTFLMYADQAASQIAVLDEIESVVAPHGPALVDLYFRVVHPAYPILAKRVFYEKYNRTYREFSPALLAAVYALALGWWEYDAGLVGSGAQRPDIEALDKLGAKALSDVMTRPKLSTVQAGLLLLQRQIPGAWTTTAQLVAVGHELGLYLDPTNWSIPDWEKGLRKRLAWALFMADKWGALTHGRPSLLHSTNWGVPLPTSSDFPDDPITPSTTPQPELDILLRGREHFCQMISLTTITSDILSAFFTLHSFASSTSISQILELAKPMQIRLRDWYAHLPDTLKMDTPTPAAPAPQLCTTGSLHLAYFTTEITLHRRILRTPIPDAYLRHICRSAAKTRLISALDFVNRLKPHHLHAFWPATAGKNFALIGTFGALLWATSSTGQEAEFYRARLMEYRWTLRVSARGAQWMEGAVGVLDSGIGKEQWEAWKARGGRIEPVAEGLGVGLLGFGTAVDTTPVPAPRRPVPVRPTLASAKAELEEAAGSESDFEEDEEMEDGVSGGSGTPVESGDVSGEDEPMRDDQGGDENNQEKGYRMEGGGGGQRAGYILMPSGDLVGPEGTGSVGRRETGEMGKWQSGGAIG